METLKLQPADKDKRAMEVFLEALALTGGPRKLIAHRYLTWVSSLIEAAHVVVLFLEAGKTAGEFAAYLGIGEQRVRNILRADLEAFQHRLNCMLAGEETSEEAPTHVAGGMVKLAYQRLKAKRPPSSGLRTWPRDHQPAFRLMPISLNGNAGR